MQRHPAALDQRDDLSLAYVELLLDTGPDDPAWAILTTRRFRAFEGGEGVAIAAYDRAACARARSLADAGDLDAAVAVLEAGMDAPANLGEGRHPADRKSTRLNSSH